MTIIKLDNHDKEMAKRILALSVAAYSTEAEIINCHDFPPLHESLQTIISSKHLFFGYFESSKLLGVIAIEDTLCGVMVNRLVVSPASFRQGVGRKLLYSITQQSGLYVVMAALKNTKALGLYRKSGFHAVKISYDPHILLTLVTLEKEINIPIGIGNAIRR